MFKVHIVFGEIASSMVEEVLSAAEESVEAGAENLKQQFDHESFHVTTQEFKTEAECTAYLMGVNDMDGWMGYSGCLDDKQAELLNKVIDKAAE